MAIMHNRVDPLLESQKTISRHLKRFLDERKTVLEPVDIEPVHRMRVASRRLRAGFSIFKDIFPPKKLEKWNKAVKKVGRVLGRARELDVQIRFLEAVRKKPKKHARAADTDEIIKSLKRQRQEAQEKIEGVLVDSDIKERLSGLKGWRCKLSGGAHRHLTKTFNAQKTEIILKRLDKLLEFSSFVSRPQSVKELHLMRIAAKKLRYTLEFLEPWYEAGMDSCIRASKRIQDYLGDVHEFDVLMQVLAAFKGRKDKDLGGTVAYLTRECLRLRKEAYARFVRLWKDLEKKKLWEKLRKVA